MANVRPIPESYYYSGQGRLAIGDRDPNTGRYSNLFFPGNVTSLTVDIVAESTEHKENMTGLRSTDRRLVTAQSGTFNFTAESLVLKLMAVGLFGTSRVASAGTVANEAHVVGEVGSAIPLMNPNVSGLTVTVAGQTAVEGTDYNVDFGFGTVYPIAGGKLVPGAAALVSYQYGTFEELNAFMSGTPPERYLRFEGLNTDNGDLVLLEIPRAAFDPVTGRDYINEEFGSAEFTGSILLDNTITATDKSRFFRERRVRAGSMVVTDGGPALVGADVTVANPNAIVLTFDAPITSAAPAGSGGFSVAATGAAMTITGVSINGQTATLATSRAVEAAEVLTLTYAPPQTNALVGTGGPVAAFVSRSVNNSIT